MSRAEERPHRPHAYLIKQTAAILEMQHPVSEAADQPMTFEVNIVPANRWTTYEYPVATAD